MKSKLPTLSSEDGKAEYWKQPGYKRETRILGMKNTNMLK
jgi:hypothetical protein